MRRMAVRMSDWIWPATARSYKKVEKPEAEDQAGNDHQDAHAEKDAQCPVQ